MYGYPYFHSDDVVLNDAYRIAVGDLAGNVVPYRGGLLEKEEFCLLAGLDYTQPWTRDTAINVWYALAFADPDLCKKTRLSVLERGDGKIRVAGSYGQSWDNVIWALGAYEYLLCHDDAEFLPFSLEVIANTLKEFEAQEFDAEKNLFGGRAVYADGVASYPDNIVAKLDKERVFALSTNCVYYRVYLICAEFAQRLGRPADSYLRKAEALKKAIEKHFWNERNQNFDYFAGESDANEGLGLSYAVLFDIASPVQKQAVMKNTHLTPHGIACEWPPFERYTKMAEDALGRHCGTIWPLAQGAWGLAALHAGRPDLFENELRLMASKAVRDMHFYEIYHSESGLPYGGWQEWEGKTVLWTSCRKQSWSASAYLALVLKGVAGLSVSDGRISARPRLPQGVNEICLKHIRVRGKTFDLYVSRGADLPKEAAFSLEELPEVLRLSF